jgi:hypothetical protein
MSQQFLKQLDETLRSPEQLSFDAVHGLIGETLRAFKEIQEKAASQKPEELQEALEMALEMKAALEGHMETLLERSGLNAQEMKKLVEETSLFSKEEQAALREIKEELVQMKEEMHLPEHPAAKKRSKKKIRMGI